MKFPTLAAAVILSVFTPVIGVAQSLQSGALLTIHKSDGSLNLGVYDSQIHSGTVQPSPCDGGDGGGLVTDAYVLQGGSPTGCDNGDSFETAQLPGTFKFVGTGYEFDVTTFYQTGGCNTSGTICANPDEGFLTVTNNGPSSFTGTITLTGNSPLAGGQFCAPGGVAVDSWITGLAVGSSVTLALAPPTLRTPIIPTAVTAADSMPRRRKL